MTDACSSRPTQHRQDGQRRAARHAAAKERADHKLGSLAAGLPIPFHGYLAFAVAT